MNEQREIIEIPARNSDSQITSKKLRVAAYCRVSTSLEAQQNSYQAQKAYYLEMIESNPDWILADIFADQGISGTSVKRPEFQRMIRWCKKGKIDLILTKSISRFARNTEDCLHYVRMLKELQIPIIFENERLNTFSMDGEFFLAMLGANSQAESEATSSRVKWGVRAAFREGKVHYQYKRWLGYRKGKDGKPEIIPEEAKVVKQIFEAYLSGKSLRNIKDMLEAEGIPTKTGLTVWPKNSIKIILQNEKYTGDALLQKTYTVDPISKRQKKNQGELPLYMVKSCHPAIISHETFKLAQEELARRTEAKRPQRLPAPSPQKIVYSSKYALSGIMVCGACNSLYRRCTWKRNGKPHIVWRCQKRLKNGPKACPNSPTIEESDLHHALITVINAMLFKKEFLLKPFEEADFLTRCQNLAEQQKEIDDYIIDLIIEHADGQNWDEDTESFRDLLTKRQAVTQSFPSEHQQLPDHLDTYNDMIARYVLDKVAVQDGKHLLVTFKGGATVEQEIYSLSCQS